MTIIQEFDFSVDLLKAILWQYNDAENLQSLLSQKQDWYNDAQTDFWNDWFDDVFNLETANDFGLQVWAIILGLTGVGIQDPTPDDKPNFGFGTFNQNFERGNFSSSSSTVPRYTIEERRILLKLRYFQLIGRATITEINRILYLVFRDMGRAVVLDNYDMTLTYVFQFAMSQKLSDALTDFDVLPRPAGVKIIRQTTPRPNIFGFGTANENFEHGNFLD